MLRYKMIVPLLLTVFFTVQSFAQNNKTKNNIVTTDTLKIEEAVKLAIANNPELLAFKYETTSLEKKKIQAGLIPNPELNFDVEDIFGSKEIKDFSQLTLTGSQLFELGGKRGSRISLVEKEINSSHGNYELLKLNVVTNVKSAFFDLYRIQKQIEQQKRFVSLNEEILKTIQTRVEAGKTSPAEESKVKVVLINSRIELNRLQRNFASAQSKLNSLLGTTGRNFFPSTDLYDNFFTPPDKAGIINAIDSIPSIRNLNNETNVRKAALELEKSQAIPDLSISGGIRYLNELKTNSFVLGASIPLPFFNRNQGNIQSAEVRLDQMDAIIRSQKFNVISAINTIHNNLLSSYNNALQLKENIIPEAEKAYDITRQGYLQGRFAFIDLLDAQRTLFDTQVQYLLELTEYYNSLIELEGITGKTFIK